MANDCYVNIQIRQNVKREYVAKLMTPLKLGVNHKAKVALCDIYFINDTPQFLNARVSIFDIAIPKYTKDKNGEVDFVRCKIENAEYTGESLCQALNEEILSKTSSEFQPRQCQFLYNKWLDRVELRIDGHSAVPDDSKVCLVVYWPLSYYLGRRIM